MASSKLARSELSSKVPESSAIGPHTVLPTGYRRVERSSRAPISPEELAVLRSEGKKVELDPETNERIIRTFVDYLPEGWQMTPAGGTQVDSLGRPIVNTAPGLPGWSQADVDALRSAIAATLASRAGALGSGAETSELDGVLGNYIGQAIVRAIPFADLASLADSADTATLSSEAARAVINYLHFYENEKFLHAGHFGYVYSPTAHSPDVVKFIEGHGADLDDVLAIDASTQTAAQHLLSTCYDRVPFTRGVTLLTGQTDIWVNSATDDASADIPTGFPLFFFYDCEDEDTNTSVRVSTNGFISFFQQGGGALDGLAFSNTPIPDLTDTDGFAAPWWDDLVVASGQGSPDRVSYKTEGGYGARVFIVEWFSMSRLGGSPSDFHYFQVKIYEASGVVELQTGSWASDPSDNATTGLENYAGTAGECGPNCLNTNSTQPPENYYFGPAPRPINDYCNTGYTLYNGDTLTQVSLRNAQANGPTGCGNNWFNRDLWYQYRATCDGTLTVSACGTRDANGNDTGPDTVMSVYSGLCDASTQIACVDDAIAPGCDPLDSVVSVPMTDGQTVYIRVTHYGAEEFRFGNGRFNLSATFAPSSPPANDACAAATPIGVGSYAGDLGCATNDGSSDCGHPLTTDAWYTFTTGTFGRLTASTCGSAAASGIDTVVSIHSGCPGNIGNQILCNDDGDVAGCASRDSRVSADLAPGQVWIRVSYYGLSSLGAGGFMLNIDFPGPAPGVVALAATKMPPSTAHLTWGSFAGATGYDAVRGSIGTLHGSGGNFTAAVTNCLANDLAANQVDDMAGLMPGTGVWYLVRAVASAGVSTYNSGGPTQVGLRDAEIVASVSACP